MRIAIVGSGISGTGAAWLLSANHSVDLYESEPHLGGHARTVDVRLDGVTFPVDTGFMVFNVGTYPNLVRFFEHLGVGSIDTDMSFAVRIDRDGIEWNGNDLNSVFSQRRNALDPRFLRMLRDVVRLSKDAERLLADRALESMSLGDLLLRERYSDTFRDWYLLPMGGAIWSTPPGRMLDYPAASFLRFMDNHGLLHVLGKPSWLAVKGGSREYVMRALKPLTGEVHTAEPVERIERTGGGVRVHTHARVREYDAVIVAAHAPDALSMLGEKASKLEQLVLGAVPYQPNDIVVHTDDSFMPRSRRTWASWNWNAADGNSETDGCSLTYWINSLQGLPAAVRPVFETLNPYKPVADETALLRMQFSHPLFTSRALEAQRRLPEIQGNGGVWYTGAWQRYGFHEDGLLSAVRVGEALGAELPWGAELDSTRTRVLHPEHAKKRPAAGSLAPQPEAAD